MIWTNHTFRCTVCGRLARASQEAIDSYRANADCTNEDGSPCTDAEIANGFEFCLGCVDGNKAVEDQEIVREVSLSQRARELLRDLPIKYRQGRNMPDEYRELLSQGLAVHDHDLIHRTAEGDEVVMERVI